MTPLFELQHVGYQQNGVPILHRVNWCVEPHEHWAVLGPNGSGKTTLLRVACGYQWPTSGRVIRQGQEHANLVEMRRTMGWVGEELIAQAPQDQTALQIAVSGAVGQLGLRLVGQVDPSEEDYWRAEKLLVDSGCGNLLEQPFRLLSQGERQKVLVARARMVDPTLLVLDEPCAGMDPAARESFLAWLQSLLADPATPAVLMVTHHVEEIMPGFDHTVIVKEGQVQAAGPASEVITAEMLASVYGVGVEQLVRSQQRLWPIWGS